MSYKKFIAENPFPAETESATKGVNLGGTSGTYGACSIEDFLPRTSDLNLTHDDAEGFLDYVTRFTPANFWYKDRNVAVWLYEETYDNWQDRYGMDAVKVFYHSGHGNMFPDGIFAAPMGSIWDNRATAWSDNMAFANEKLRYLFWSTCLGLRISEGHNPIRTWSRANKGGLRMIFGYDTVSYDNKNYGKFFWNEWNKGRSFKEAFIEASWRISHRQSPVVCAMGANQAEAKARLANERFFYTPGVCSNYWAWEWRNAVRKAKRESANLLKEPRNKNALILAPDMLDDTLFSAIGNKAGLTKRTASTIKIDDMGTRIIGTKDLRVSVNRAGHVSLDMAKANYRNTELIGENKALKLAEGFISELGLAKGIKLEQATTYHTMQGGGNAKTEELYDPKVIETIIQFRQEHDNLKSVNSGHGLISVAVDNDGKITRVFSSLKPIVDEREQASAPRKGKSAPAKEFTRSRDELFQQQIDRIIGGKDYSTVNFDERTKTLLTRETADITPTVKIIDEKIGYDFSSNIVKPVHQRDVEIAVGPYAKRYKLRVDL